MGGGRGDAREFARRLLQINIFWSVLLSCHDLQLLLALHCAGKATCSSFSLKAQGIADPILSEMASLAYEYTVLHLTLQLASDYLSSNLSNLIRMKDSQGSVYPFG